MLPAYGFTLGETLAEARTQGREGGRERVRIGPRRRAHSAAHLAKEHIRERIRKCVDRHLDKGRPAGLEGGPQSRSKGLRAVSLVVFHSEALDELGEIRIIKVGSDQTASKKFFLPASDIAICLIVEHDGDDADTEPHGGR